MRARAFAHRLLESGAESRETDAILNRAFELAYGRPPTPDELSAAEAFIKEQNVIYRDQKDPTVRVWTDFCQMLLASNAFLYVD